MKHGIAAAQAAVFILAAAAAPAHAADAPGKYLSVGAAYTDPDEGRGADRGIGFVAGYASPRGQRQWWELRLFTHVLETGASGSDFYSYGGGVDLVTALGPLERPHWYTLLGGGGVVNDVFPNDEDGSSGYANAGIGRRFNAWDEWGLRPRFELRAVYDGFDGGQTDLQFNLILEIPPKRVVVEEKIVEKVVEKIVEVPKEVVKEVEVPPADSDGDGIPDAIDRCPNTIQGAAVGPDGCVKQEQTITLPNIEFESAKAVMRPAGREKLTPVVEFLKSQPNVALDVYGHTDASGPESLNQRLSEERAAAVREYLVSQGIAAERLTSRGFGESQPIASNETAEGKSKNRRVELRIRTQ